MTPIAVPAVIVRHSRPLAAVLAAVLAGAVLVGLAPAAAAEEVDDLTVEAVVSADTTMAVTETIAYDFEFTVAHGIYRDIPVVEDLVSGDQRHYGIEVTSVRMDGRPVAYETGPEGNFLRVRIGNPDTFVTDTHEYVIEYRVTGALRPMTVQEAVAIGGQGGDAELYWNFVGSGWSVQVANAQATVTGPADILAVGCFAGSYGSDASCPASTSGPVVVFGPVRLPANASLTGAAAWPAAAFTMPVVQDIRMGPGASAGRGALVGGVAGLVAIATMIGLALAWRRKDVGASLPLAPPSYGPPCDLAPAEMVAALEGTGSSATSLMATLLDLAARGWVRLSVHDDEQVSLARTAAGTGELREWEATLLETVFGDRSTASLGEYDAGLAARWTGIGIRLVDAAEAAGYRNPDGGRPDRRWTWFGIAGAGMVVASGAWLIFGGAALLPAAGATFGLGLVIGWIAATVITPRAQTQTSARLLAEVDGLKKVLGTDPAASRQLFAQASGLAPAAILATMLPYAVALGLEDAWVAAFPDLEREELAGFGLDVVSASLLGAMVASAVSTASGALTAPASSTSSSSGGSGLSGGGFSGGGGGGGGGGSW